MVEYGLKMALESVETLHHGENGENGENEENEENEENGENGENKDHRMDQDHREESLGSDLNLKGNPLQRTLITNGERE
jgi:hypothetical protein